MTTYNWTATGLQRFLDTGRVYRVDFCIELVVDGVQKYLLDNLGFEIDEENTAPSVAFEDLTPEICIGWVKDGLGPEGVAEQEAVIDSLYPPTISDTLPTDWPT